MFKNAVFWARQTQKQGRKMDPELGPVFRPRISNSGHNANTRTRSTRPHTRTKPTAATTHTHRPTHSQTPSYDHAQPPERAHPRTQKQSRTHTPTEPGSDEPTHTHTPHTHTRALQQTNAFARNARTHTHTPTPTQPPTATRTCAHRATRTHNPETLTQTHTRKGKQSPKHPHTGGFTRPGIHAPLWQTAKGRRPRAPSHWHARTPRGFKGSRPSPRRTLEAGPPTRRNLRNLRASPKGTWGTRAPRASEREALEPLIVKSGASNPSAFEP